MLSEEEVEELKEAIDRTRKRVVHAKDAIGRKTGNGGYVVITDGLERAGVCDSELVIKPSPGYALPQFVYTPSMPASKAGSKGYQRRQNQRWPKGR